jgi:hypothetical protein
MEVYRQKGQWRRILNCFFCAILAVACSCSNPTPSRVSYRLRGFQVPVVVDISLGGQLQRVKGEMVTSRFFSTQDCRPYLGRLFRADDYDSRVVVLSYRLWERLLESNPSVIGQRLNLIVQPNIDGTPYVVIGVTPPSFTGAELWIHPYRVLLAPSGSGKQAKELNQRQDWGCS